MLSVFAREPRGRIVGSLNSARFTGNAVGPILAATLPAFSNLAVLYLSLSAIALFTLAGFKLHFKTAVPY